MAQKAEQPHPLLQRPLYVFDLPDEILQTLSLRGASDPSVSEVQAPSPATETEAASSEKATKKDPEDGAPSTATSCALCGLTFPSLQDQRSHVRSDLHGYNLKQKIKGLKPVSEAEFEKLIGELDESISGSETSESEQDEEEEGSKQQKDDMLSALLKRQAKLSSPDDDTFSTSKKPRGPGKPPLLWFTTPSLPDRTTLGIYRAIFSAEEQDDESSIVESLRRKQLSPVPAQATGPKQDGQDAVKAPTGPHYFLCMIGGGHFAAMVVALAPKVGKKQTGQGDRQATVIAHKTFHRYTTRRKQGGSQSMYDSANGNASSAGSSLRRYNEAALTNEIRTLLTEWKSMIDTAELLFIRAAGNTNRRVLFGPYDGQVLRQNDPRNRAFPFSTRRATQSELMRAFVELTRVKVSYISEEALAQASEAAAAPAKDSAKKPKPKPQKEKVDETAVLHTTQLTSLIRRSKAPGLLSYLSSNSLSPNFAFQPPSQHIHAPTPLHLASSTSSPILVLSLLTKAKADPTIRNDEGQTPFQLANDRQTRDAFRVARSELGEDYCSWDEAHVPAPLSKADYEKRQQRDVEERKAAEAAESERRKAETDRLRKQSEKEEQEKKDKKFNRAGAGRVLTAEKTAAEKREEEARGMTPEMRQRLERERRARAAEERIKRMQGRG